jgi:hypothetical protein
MDSGGQMGKSDDSFFKAENDKRVLSDDDNETMLWIKDQGLTMMEYIDARIPKGREASLAKTKIEEAVMWAVKGLTNG